MAEAVASRGDPVDGVLLVRLRPLFRLLRYLGPHRRYVGLTVLFGSAGFLLSFAYPYLIGEAIDLIASSGTPHAQRQQGLFTITQQAVLVALLHSLVVYGRGHFNVLLGNSIVMDLRAALFEHLQKLSARFYAKQQTGAILSRVLQDVKEATSIIYVGVVVAFLDAAQLVLALLLLINISPRLTLACALILPLYALLFFLRNGRVRAASGRVSAMLSRISGDMAERVAGHALVKTYTAERREADNFVRSIRVQHGLIRTESHEGHVVAGASELLVDVGTTMVVGYGGWLALQGELSAGMLTRFLGYVVILYGPVRRFAELNVTYQSSLSAMRRIFRVLEIRPAIVERPVPHMLPPSVGHVQLEAVSFSYDDASDESRSLHDDEPARSSQPVPGQQVIRDLHLTVLPGERVALVGPSGAGKSTLVSLLPRLYDVSHGRVLIDGIDVRDYSLHALRSAIAIVQQDSFIFSGSVRENIAYGRPEATEQEIVEAARAAHAHDFISALPGGYAALLGERGVTLSGGQRQRLSIARALLKDPRILILDEATSSLDAESEYQVQQALDRLMRGRTCFIIAHRLSTIRHADRILVLDGGRIVESGTHEQLMDANGRYAQFIRTQMSVV